MVLTQLLFILYNIESNTRNKRFWLNDLPYLKLIKIVMEKLYFYCFVRTYKSRLLVRGCLTCSHAADCKIIIIVVLYVNNHIISYEYQIYSLSTFATIRTWYWTISYYNINIIYNTIDNRRIKTIFYQSNFRYSRSVLNYMILIWAIHKWNLKTCNMCRKMFAL